MKLLFRFFNCEVGFFIKKRFNFIDLFNKIKFNKVLDENKDDIVKKDKWQLEFGVEKRIQAITGYNFENGKIEKSGTCLLSWLFRDVHTNILLNQKYFDAVMDVPLENTENWREILLKNGANNKQIQIFNICSGNKLRFVMEKVASENYDLFTCIVQHYDEDTEFNILINSTGDLK